MLKIPFPDSNLNIFLIYWFLFFIFFISNLIFFFSNVTEDHRGVILSLYTKGHWEHGPHGSVIISVDGIPENRSVKHWFPISSKEKITGAVEVLIEFKVKNRIFFLLLLFMKLFEWLRNF